VRARFLGGRKRSKTAAALFWIGLVAGLFLPVAGLLSHVDRAFITLILRVVLFLAFGIPVGSIDTRVGENFSGSVLLLATFLLLTSSCCVSIPWR
jgi:hypothetical protein